MNCTCCTRKLDEKDLRAGVCRHCGTKIHVQSYRHVGTHVSHWTSKDPGVQMIPKEDRHVFFQGPPSPGDGIYEVKTILPESQPGLGELDPELPRLNLVEKVALVRQVADWVYDMTETLSHEVHGKLPMQLAYLYPAILGDRRIEVRHDEPITLMFRMQGDYSDIQTPPPMEVWYFIDVVDESEDEEKP